MHSESLFLQDFFFFATGICLPTKKDPDYDTELGSKGREDLLEENWSTIFPAHLCKPNMKKLARLVKQIIKWLKADNAELSESGVNIDRLLFQYALIIANWR